MKSLEKLFSNIRKAIFSVNNESELNSVVQTQAEALLKSERQSFQIDFQEEFEELTQAVKEAELYFDCEFSNAYHRLQVLTKNLSTTVEIKDSSVQLNTSEILAAMQSCNSELQKKDEGTALKGGAAGAVVGSMIFPGVGTVVGGVVGTFVSALFMPTLDERKQKLWTQLSPSLEVYFDATRGQVHEVLRTYTRNVMAALDRRINTCIAQYKAAVDAMLNEQTAELQRLTELQASTQANLLEIDRRKKALFAQQQRLAGIAG